MSLLILHIPFKSQHSRGLVRQLARTHTTFTASVSHTPTHAHTLPHRQRVCTSTLQQHQRRFYLSCLERGGLLRRSHIPVRACVVIRIRHAGSSTMSHRPHTHTHTDTHARVGMQRPSVTHPSAEADLAKGHAGPEGKLPVMPMEIQRKNLKPCSPAYPYSPSTMLVSIWNGYLDVLGRRPLATKMFSSGLICGLSDTIAQFITYTGDPAAFILDKQRFVLFVVLGTIYGPPIGHYWFNFIDRLSRDPRVTKWLPKNSRYGPAAFQLALDQTLAAPVVNSGFLLIFWLSQAALRGDPVSLAAALARLGKEFWPMMIANWKLWPAANMISFSFVPLKLRVLYSNVVSIAWTVFMSATANH